MTVELKFKTYQLAANWAKENPNHTISRCISGDGYVGIIKSGQVTDTISSSKTELDSDRVATFISRVSSEFFKAIEYSIVGRLASRNVLKFLDPLDIKQLVLLRAAIEFQLLSAQEVCNAGLNNGNKLMI